MPSPQSSMAGVRRSGFSDDAGNGLEGRLEIGEGLDVVDFRGLDEGCDAAPGEAALVMTGEQCIFPVMQRWA